MSAMLTLIIHLYQAKSSVGEGWDGIISLLEKICCILWQSEDDTAHGRMMMMMMLQRLSNPYSAASRMNVSSIWLQGKASVHQIMDPFSRSTMTHFRINIVNLTFYLYLNLIYFVFVTRLYFVFYYSAAILIYFYNLTALINRGFFSLTEQIMK